MKLPLIGTIGTVAILLGLAAVPAYSLPSVYEVRSGDSLWEIAARFGTSVSKIKELNKLKSTRIYPGQKLRVGAMLKEILVPNGPYYWRRPKSSIQKSTDYSESSKSTAFDDYGQATRLLQAYRADLNDRFRKAKDRGKPLKGWRIVLDPGHGGRDPGAIVSNRDGRNREIQKDLQVFTPLHFLCSSEPLRCNCFQCLVSCFIFLLTMIDMHR